MVLLCKIFGHVLYSGNTSRHLIIHASTQLTTHNNRTNSLSFQRLLGHPRVNLIPELNLKWNNWDGKTLAIKHNVLTEVLCPWLRLCVAFFRLMFNSYIGQLWVTQVIEDVCSQACRESMKPRQQAINVSIKTINDNSAFFDYRTN